MDLSLGGSVQVLEFVHRLELDNVEPVGYDTVRLPLQEVFRFVCRDV